MKGSKNRILSRNLKHRHNITLWNLVIRVWFQRVGHKHGAEARLEKGADFATKPNTLRIHVYGDGWMCFEPECERFWKIVTNSPPELIFDATYLNFHSLPDPEIRPHFSLVPDLLPMVEENATTCRIALKGICSDDMATAAGSAVCSFQEFVKIRPISLRNVVDGFDLAPIRRAMNFEQGFMLPEIDDSSLLPYRNLTYKLDGVGCITHFVANKEVNSRPKGPDHLFIGLQRGDPGLK
ncbi:hypothetical protein N7461_001177 [Penicillium sp. DV-2018c]|nr:hypothetical protein N7461_001177 [Penicillium sp. DV-2018c]